MKKLELSDILDIAQYERIRHDFRKEVMELKSRRRLSIGENMTMLFECRKTVLFQIQEMIRVERIVDERAIQREIDTYNQLIPGKDELSATLFIEVLDTTKIREVMDSFIGLPQHCVYFHIGGEQIEARFDLEQSTETRVSAVQYITFSIPTTIQSELRRNEAVVEINVTHPNYVHTAVIPVGIREELVKDLLP